MARRRQLISSFINLVNEINVSHSGFVEFLSNVSSPFQSDFCDAMRK